jgi:hypothetical protein
MHSGTRLATNEIHDSKGALEEALSFAAEMLFLEGLEVCFDWRVTTNDL